MSGPPPWTDLDACVEGYESARARDGKAAIEDFLPPADHPESQAILCELIRVDLEYGYARGQPTSVAAYRERFPTLFRDAARAREIAFEDARLRRQHRSPSPGTSQPLAEPRGGDELASLERWLGTLALDDDPGSLARSVHDSSPDLADRLGRAVGLLPEVGERFLGFRLESELGRGAFGRVYLARQGDLADRRVALKVSADVAVEAQALAQLQHTNIVPIYSVHRHGPLRAVCMPYLGSATLADVVRDLRSSPTLPASGAALVGSLRASAQPATAAAAADATTPPVSAEPLPLTRRATPQVDTLRGLDFIRAVLWIGRRLADGLAHAHEHGILHRDLKPANVLLSDDGEPVLLDFNMAADTKRPVALAQLGGTLPYMAPEHLAAFTDPARVVDARGDVYALGVILFELLTGRHPFRLHRGPIEDAIPRMLADRRGPAPSVRALNPAASPAVDAIVARCLAPDPAGRYASAAPLAEDLQRQLDHLPLRHAPEPSVVERVSKWAHRHPRLTSNTSLALIATALIAALGLLAYRRLEQIQRFEAREALRATLAARDAAFFLLGTRGVEPAQVAEGQALCQRALGRFGLPEGHPWSESPLFSRLSDVERQTVRAALGELLLLWSRSLGQSPKSLDRASALLDQAETLYGVGESPRAAFLARADLEAARGRAEEAKQLRVAAERMPLRTLNDRLLLLGDHLDRSDDRAALAYLRAAGDTAPADPTLWLVLGDRYARLGLRDDARDCYSLGLALEPAHAWALFHRGLLALESADPRRAEADFGRVIGLRPDLTAARVNRALARLALADAPGAIDDLTRALEDRDVPTRAWFIRARARAQVGDAAGAAADRAEGLKRTPTDALSWVSRGLARLPDDPTGALADFDSALELDPDSLEALQNTASVLAEQSGRTEAAIATLDRLLRAHRKSVPALAGRGVLLARLGRREAAVRDAQAALELDPSPATCYQIAGLYAQTARQAPDDAQTALDLLGQALRGDPTWLDTVAKDPDLDPLRDRPDFTQLIRAAELVSGHHEPSRQPESTKAQRGASPNP